MGSEVPAFQDDMPYNHCVGCGATNELGHHVQGRWDDQDPDVAICDFEPQPHHSAYPADVVNGGIIATVIDCHSIGTAIADAHRQAGRPIGEGELILYATAALTVDYLKPTPISGPFRVNARVVEVTDKRTNIESTVVDKSGDETARGRVVAVVVPSSWANPEGVFADD